jgi:hypothetical protein
MLQVTVTAPILVTTNWEGDLALGHAAKVDYRAGVCSMCSRS